MTICPTIHGGLYGRGQPSKQHYFPCFASDENPCVIGCQKKSEPPPPPLRLNIFQLSVDAPRGGSVHASGTLPGVNTSSYYRRLNFYRRVVSKKVVLLGKSRNRCERPLTLARLIRAQAIGANWTHSYTLPETKGMYCTASMALFMRPTTIL